MTERQFWDMTFPEFFRRVKGFEKRQEMEWRRTYSLWRLQVQDPPSFDEFMGRKRVLSDEERFNELWEHIERDRQSAEPKVTEHASTTS